jgi:Transposase IS116/IS110/IS902 family
MRFPCGKQIGSYLGMIPSEDSSAGKQRLGHISKQGNPLLRFLLVEAAQAAVRHDPDWPVMPTTRELELTTISPMPLIDFARP